MKNTPMLRPGPRLLSRGIAAAVLFAAVAAGWLCTRGSDESPGTLNSSLTASIPLPTDTAVSSGTLANGVQYFARRLPNAARATRLLLLVRAGSVDEAPGERGFAHFVEHVAMDPAQRFGELAPAELLTRLGQTMGSDANAETHFAHTQYFLRSNRATQ
jgi:predicted Zn-dependent peptidase